MPLTTQNTGAALVGRPANLEERMKTMTVKVLRPFYYNREALKLGATVELPAVFALEMCAANKAERVDDVAAPAAPSDKSKGKGEGKGKDGEHAGK